MGFVRAFTGHAPVTRWQVSTFCPRCCVTSRPWVELMTSSVVGWSLIRSRRRLGLWDPSCVTSRRSFGSCWLTPRTYPVTLSGGCHPLWHHWHRWRRSHDLLLVTGLTRPLGLGLHSATPMPRVAWPCRWRWQWCGWCPDWAPALRPGRTSPWGMPSGCLTKPWRMRTRTLQHLCMTRFFGRTRSTRRCVYEPMCCLPDGEVVWAHSHHFRWLLHPGRLHPQRGDQLSIGPKL